MRKWKKTLAFMIAITVITMGTTSLSDNAEAKSLPVKVTINDSHVELTNKPLLINGAVLLPLREIGTLTGWLTLIDRKTNKETRLADVLLDKEKLEIYRTLDIRDSYFYHWDGLKVKERAGSSLLLSHVYFMDQTETDLTYNLTEN